MSNIMKALGTAVVAGTIALAPAATALAQAEPMARESTYADLVDLSDASNMVLQVKIRKQAEVKAERAPGLSPGMARLYVEADTLALLTGNSPVRETVKYLVDVPLDAKGRAPKLKKQDMLLFAKAVPGRAGEIQLVGQGAQIRWTPELEARVRPILSGLVAPDAPPVVTGVQDALSVKGNLVGESETQLFLSTRRDAPVSVTVIRRPGQQPTWGVSFSEIVDQSAVPPRPDTLEWYRLACFLPQELPGEANLSRDAAARAQAAEDYQYMMSQLGPCPRNRL
ncbi:hypothetical protein [Allopontixanthobacter sediminis]|uniref:Uncharacterized protein n=1 Tax=Allopontixanthobacter sediminis TaxID=1689985 RepID=A0A845B2R1_9SPHN|nr:hypothetical protein [Allopontixanthobacter sediminis]MXP44700.1 hypothetical protein [Allopontixanthobacter sediminis]